MPISSIWRPHGDDAPWQPLLPAAFSADLVRSHPHFTVEGLLGWGGMGAVYVATDTRREHRVAIKMLRPDLLDDADAVRRFDGEIKSLAGLRHPNVVRLLDAGVTPDGSRFLVMDLLTGGTLASRIGHGQQFAPREVLDLMVSICAGVDYIHQQGYVHRDLKAANIFLTNEGRPVVLDFGIARPYARPAATASRLNVPGTEGYVAPEVLLGQPATPRSDVFALGVVLLHLVTGVPPTAGHAWPSDFGFNAEVDQVAKKALDRDPESRWQSAGEFAAALARAFSHGDAGPSEAQEPHAARRSVAEATDHRLRLHRGFLASWKPVRDVTVLRDSAVPTATEDWEIVAQWTAFPDLPTFDWLDATVRRRFSIQRTTTAATVVIFAAATVILREFTGPKGIVETIALGMATGALAAVPVRRAAGWVFDRLTDGALPSGIRWVWPQRPSLFVFDWWTKNAEPKSFEPRTLLWHPREPMLFATRDHCWLSSWHLQEPRTDRDREPGSLVARQVFGGMDLFAVGRMKGVVWSESGFLVRSESFWWWDADEPTEHWIVYDSRGLIQGWLSEQSRRHLSLFGPAEDGVLACNPWRPGTTRELLVSTAPDTLTVIDAHALPKGRFLMEAPSDLDRWERSRVSVAALRIDTAEGIESYAWHPSGAYLALAIGGRLYIVHWDSAELVSQHVPPLGEKYSAQGWNSTGTLLALDERAARVWDARVARPRVSVDSEPWSIVAAASLNNKRRSSDGLRHFSEGADCRPNFGSWGNALDGVRDVAWAPNDPETFATAGGTACPRDIRVWRRRTNGAVHQVEA